MDGTGMEQGWMELGWMGGWMEQGWMENRLDEQLSGLIQGQFPLTGQEEGPADLQGLEQHPCSVSPSLLSPGSFSLQVWDRDS